LPTTVISTAAGVGNGGLAVRQTLDSPAGIALDSHGNVFIADNLDQEIREFIPGTGTMLTVAGDGVAGYTGDGGPATDAELSSPDGIAVDAAGNVFFTQYGDDVVREIHAGTGVITTVAGNGKQGSSGDGGPATSAELYGPSGVAVDSLGNLFIADSVNFRIRKVTSATGAITTVAGNGTEGASGDGGPATSALLQGPDDAVVDSSGDLFIADGSSVREVTAATGVITTIAGGGSYT
jgi:sugar lactone lactonase YvrE